MSNITRRDVLQASTIATGAAALAQLPSVATASDKSGKPVGSQKVVVAGGHPDDPESGCGGTIARYADTGHEVVAIYLTRGEAGMPGTSYEEAARIRSAEAEKACKIMKARPVFAGQIDGSAEVTNQRYAEFIQLLHAEEPDVVFTHWPIDAHRDHRATSLLTYDAWLQSGQSFALYYYEVLTGEQSHNFHPTDYVDITSTKSRKDDAIMAHASQQPEWIHKHHDQMDRFRGLECGSEFAEAFVRQMQSRSAAWPA